MRGVHPQIQSNETMYFFFGFFYVYTSNRHDDHVSRKIRSQTIRKDNK